MAIPARLSPVPLTAKKTGLMKPGERISLIKGAVEALLPRMGHDADLVLHQFGAEYDQSYGRDVESRRRYLTWSVQELENSELTALHDYVVGGEQAPVSVAADDNPWGDQPIRVFLSHKSEDTEWVSSLRDKLTNYGITAFMSHQDINPSKHWREVIKAGLRACHMMAPTLHDDFHKSQWCDQEVGWALGRGVPIATLRRSLEFDRGLDGFLAEFQDIQLDPSKGNGEWRAAQEIFRAAIRSVKPPELVRRALAEALITSPTFKNSQNLWPAIKRQDQWEQASLDRIKYAVQTNRQVYDAKIGEETLASLVSALVEQHEPKPFPWAADDSPF
jgi:hypothetical protein